MHERLRVPTTVLIFLPQLIGKGDEISLILIDLSDYVLDATLRPGHLHINFSLFLDVVELGLTSEFVNQVLYLYRLLNNFCKLLLIQIKVYLRYNLLKLPALLVHCLHLLSLFDLLNCSFGERFEL